MTALLLICVTLMGQSQPAQLDARLMNARGRVQLEQSENLKPFLRAQFRLLASIELQTIFHSASQAVVAADCKVEAPASSRSKYYGASIASVLLASGNPRCTRAP